MVKVKMSNPTDFFPDPPARPERFPEDYEDDLEEDCVSCGKQFGEHTTRDIVECALREVRGGRSKT